MSEKHDAMWGADAGQYIGEQETEIARLRAALEQIRDLPGRFVNEREKWKRMQAYADKALAKEGK